LKIFKYEAVVAVPIEEISCGSHESFQPHDMALPARGSRVELRATVGMKNNSICLLRASHIRHLQGGNHSILTHVISNCPTNDPAGVVISDGAFVGEAFTAMPIRNVTSPDPAYPSRSEHSLDRAAG